MLCSDQERNERRGPEDVKVVRYRESNREARGKWQSEIQAIAI